MCHIGSRKSSGLPIELPCSGMDTKPVPGSRPRFPLGISSQRWSGARSRLFFDRKTAIREEVVLEVRDLACGGMLEGLSFTVRAGEVVGLAALAGCGITELFETIFGLRREAGRNGAS